MLAMPAILRLHAGGPLAQQLTERKEFNLEIKRNGSQPSSKGPADWFIGTVRIDPLFQANAPARAADPRAATRARRGAAHDHHVQQRRKTRAGPRARRGRD